SGPRALAAIASQDPVLVGALMRIGNSPVFYQQGHASTLVDVVSRLGGSKTLAVAVSTALHSRIEGVPAHIVDGIWARSVQVAGYALEAAMRQRRRNLVDAAYLAALIHEAGTCVLLKRFPQRAKLLDHKSGAAYDEAVLAADAAEGTDHSAVGCIVARNWKLPPAVCESIRIHHLPEAAATVDAEAAAVAALVAVGRRVVDGPTPEWDGWAPVAQRYVGIDELALNALSEPTAA
ncbi:MAG TPA: HDOD domain-containing protein, partial [Casimicrobiaceae bacterium]|nr:HDOD domain-containing protein [Casimicrobiaceae bacterium]